MRRREKGRGEGGGEGGEGGKGGGGVRGREEGAGGKWRIEDGFLFSFRPDFPPCLFSSLLSNGPAPSSWLYLLPLKK